MSSNVRASEGETILSGRSRAQQFEQIAADAVARGVQAFPDRAGRINHNSTNTALLNLECSDVNHELESIVARMEEILLKPTLPKGRNKQADLLSSERLILFRNYWLNALFLITETTTADSHEWKVDRKLQTQRIQDFCCKVAAIVKKYKAECPAYSINYFAYRHRVMLEFLLVRCLRKDFPTAEFTWPELKQESQGLHGIMEIDGQKVLLQLATHQETNVSLSCGMGTIRPTLLHHAVPRREQRQIAGMIFPVAIDFAFFPLFSNEVVQNLLALESDQVFLEILYRSIQDAIAEQAMSSVTSN